jgi:hypothetical protein
MLILYHAEMHGSAERIMDYNGGWRGFAMSSRNPENEMNNNIFAFLSQSFPPKPGRLWRETGEATSEKQPPAARVCRVGVN